MLDDLCRAHSTTFYLKVATSKQIEAAISVYEDIFQNTPAMHATLVVGNRNRRDTKNELIRKRPKKTLLYNTITKSKSSKKTYIYINIILLSYKNISLEFFVLMNSTRKEKEMVTENSFNQTITTHIVTIIIVNRQSSKNLNNQEILLGFET